MTIQPILNLTSIASIFLSLLISIPVTKATADPISNADQTLGFANHLFDTGDYYRAITEYRRHLFLYPQSNDSNLIKLKIALAYLEGKEYDIAFESLDNIANQQDNQFAQTARLRLAGGLYSEKQYNNAIAVISPAARTPSNKNEINIFLGLCQLHNGNRRKAESYFTKINTDCNSQELLDACKKYENIPQKKKWLAGTMSALLPGSGQLYVKRPHDAAWAFLLNSIFLSATYYAFDNDETVAAIFAASLEAVWYTGNIYNAANGARKYNQHQEQIFFTELEDKTIYNQEKPIYQLLFRIPL